MADDTTIRDARRFLRDKGDCSLAEVSPAVRDSLDRLIDRGHVELAYPSEKIHVWQGVGKFVAGERNPIAPLGSNEQISWFIPDRRPDDELRDWAIGGALLIRLSGDGRAAQREDSAQSRSAVGQGGEYPSVYVETVVMGDQNNIKDSTTVIRSTVKDSAKIVRDDNSTDGTGKPKSWFARLFESVPGQVVASLLVLAIVGITIWNWPWIKAFLG